MSATEELRFGFGKNWAAFIDKNFSDEVVDQSQRRLAEFLRLDSLAGKTFLDIGCGSGLHSLAAHRLGAERIVSFDYDPDSVATTERLRRHAGEPGNWQVMQGSVLDRTFMEARDKADIVYSWGVLHHTGDMWTAIRNAALPLKEDGVFFIALYSADAHVDPPAEYWLDIKRRYNSCSTLGRRIMEGSYLWRFHILPALRSGQNPWRLLREKRYRGMEFWTDLRDWLGGYPMEFAGFGETRDFCQRELGLDLVNSSTGEANTEYLFCRRSRNPHWARIDGMRRQQPLDPPFAKLDGFAYVSALPGLAAIADGNEAPRRSQLMLYEDGRPLGLGHSLHAHIVKYGGGRFSHWGDNLYFSAADNSDPNGNGRLYTICTNY
jgi:SAM-dependent methyltransferase